MWLSPEFVNMLQQFHLPETQYFDDDREITHKFLYLLYKAKLQIQPEVIWSSEFGNDSDYQMVKAALSVDLFLDLLSRKNQLHLQIGHPLTAHFLASLNKVSKNQDAFEVFVERHLEDQSTPEKAEIYSQPTRAKIS